MSRLRRQKRQVHEGRAVLRHYLTVYSAASPERAAELLRSVDILAAALPPVRDSEPLRRLFTAALSYVLEARAAGESPDLDAALDVVDPTRLIQVQGRGLALVFAPLPPVAGRGWRAVVLSGTGDLGEHGSRPALIEAASAVFARLSGESGTVSDTGS